MAMRVLRSGALGAAAAALVPRTCNAIKKAAENTHSRANILARMSRLLSHRKRQNLTRDAVSERRLALSSYSDVPCEAFRILLIHRTLPGDIPQTSDEDVATGTAPVRRP